MTDIDEVLRFARLRTELQGLADEVAIRFARSSFSPIIRDYLDFSTALCTGDGQMLAQGFSLPLHLGAVPRAMRAVLDRFPGGLAPGDVVVSNDPYAGGMHLPDIFMFAPAVIDGTVIGYVVVVAHHADVGGRVPGGSAADSREIFQEGLRLPPVLLSRGGRIDPTVEAIVRANVRLPDLVWNDVRAQLAGCLTGVTGLCALARRYGVQAFLGHGEELMDYSERRLTAILREWPAGTYRFVDWEDHDGVSERLVRLEVAVTVADGRVSFDFSGTSAQVAGAINATASFTESACYAAVRALCGEEVPVNAGFFRPIEVRAPEGTVVNARFPAAVAARGVIGYRIIDAVYGALAGALPRIVPAAGDGGISGIRFGGIQAGRRFQLNDIMCGAWGGRPGLDGLDGAATMAANVANRSIERTERDEPVRVLAYEFVPDSAGPGRWRGGLALRRVLEFLGDEAVLQARTHRSVTPPYGLAGGEPGSCSRTFLTRNGKTEPVPGKATLTVVRGDVLEHVTASGGGHGPPAERDRDLVRDDLLDGKITEPHARRSYRWEDDQ